MIHCKFAPSFSGEFGKTLAIIAPMLERLRRHHRLQTLVLGLFAALWLVALTSGAQIRMVLPLLGHAAATSTSMADMGYCGMVPQASELMAWLGEDAAPDEHSASAHTPACLLCIALAAPGQVRSTLYRPPLLAGLRLPGNPGAAPRGWLAQAPLPARGPPLLHG